MAKRRRLTARQKLLRRRTKQLQDIRGQVERLEEEIADLRKKEAEEAEVVRALLAGEDQAGG